MNISSLSAWSIIVLATMAPSDRTDVAVYRGQVLPLAEVLKKENIELDKDAEPTSLVVQSEDGKLIPLVKDGGSRLFYQDTRLLRRPMEIQGRLVAKGTMLQALRVVSLKNGKPHEIYYWCDVCAIRRDAQNVGGICDCCGGKMELKEVPVGK
jgi:hypothetical protein